MPQLALFTIHCGEKRKQRKPNVNFGLKITGSGLAFILLIFGPNFSWEKRRKMYNPKNRERHKYLIVPLVILAISLAISLFAKYSTEIPTWKIFYVPSGNFWYLFWVIVGTIAFSLSFVSAITIIGYLVYKLSCLIFLKKEKK